MRGGDRYGSLFGVIPGDRAGGEEQTGASLGAEVAGPMAGLAHRRPLIWLVTLGWCLVASGLPFPGSGVAERGGGPPRRVAKDRSRPFPCMDSPCGCASAQQCLTSCCCHTPAERLAWARRHGVEVGVLEALERLAAPTSRSACSNAAEGACGECELATGHVAGHRVAGHHVAGHRVAEPMVAAAPSCCATGGARSQGAGRSTANPPGAMGAPDGATGSEGTQEPDGGARDRATSVVLRAMLACQGVTLAGGGVAVPLPPLPVRPCGDTLIVPAATPGDRPSHGRRDRPEPPPPRRLAA